jgi:methionyl-tRNA formyltransferase
MDKQSIRIIYMGTPDFAVESLRALVEGGYRVVAVVTMPDKPAGRGMQLRASAVKEYALSQNLPVLQPERLKDEAFLEQLRALNADLQIVVAFRMLPEVVWNMPPMGTFNLHASLLPQYRGAAPINWAIINGDKETGITTFFLQHEIDTGNIILQKRIPISRNDNAESIHDTLMKIGAEAVVETVRLIEKGNVKTIAQEDIADSELRPAPKIFKETCRINWNDEAEHVRNFIRGLSPYPAAHTEIADAKGTALGLKVFDSETEICHHNLPAGKFIAENSELKVAVKDGFVKLLRVQLAGKKPMDTEDFLRGFKIG